MQESPDIKAVIARAGGPKELARKLGLSHSTVCEWERIPPHHVPAVSEVTGLGRHQLRPDLYEAPAPRKTRRIVPA